MTPRRRAVITGMGVMTPVGCELASAWAALLDGKSGVRTIDRFDPVGFPSRVAGLVPDAELSTAAYPSEAWRTRGPNGRLAAAAARKAVEDAGDPFLAPERCGVVIATGTGVFDHDEIFKACAGARASRSTDMDWERLTRHLLAALGPDALARRTPGGIAAQLADDYGLRGPTMAVMTACAAGTQTIGDALRWIRMGRADVVLAGGADADVTPLALASFCLLGALSRRNDAPSEASRPFDAGRDGFVMAEGAAMLVLEEREHALRRGARIYAEVAGFGSACDAYRVTDPHPDGDGAVLAMQRALANAQLGPSDIGYVNAHGTSTIANDRAETRALRRVFGAGAERVAVNSTKSMLGHSLAAAGAIEAVVTALTLQTQHAHPTINLETPDAACDLDYIPNVSRRISADAALSNSFAFGGQTASLVLQRAAS